MVELRLHAELYSAAAIEVAEGAFADLASISRGRDGDYHVLQVSVQDEREEPELAAALANYALTATIENRR